MGIVSTFMLWGPFNSKFLHCTDYVALLQLPHIFGTYLDWCSEFSCVLRVKSHFINTRFYVCSFYIPYAKPVWSDCQHTSQIWVTGCLPLVHCLFRRASWEEHFGSVSQAASCCTCEQSVYAETLVPHEWRRGWALKCISCCMWMQVWFQSLELLTKVSSHPRGGTVLGERNHSEFNLQSLQSTKCSANSTAGSGYYVFFFWNRNAPQSLI